MLNCRRETGQHCVMLLPRAPTKRRSRVLYSVPPGRVFVRVSGSVSVCGMAEKLLIRNWCNLVRVRVSGHLYSALLWDESIAGDAQIWPVIAKGSHSFTCHPLTNHTCLYSPAAGHDRPLAGNHGAYPRMDGQAELPWVIGYILR